MKIWHIATLDSKYYLETFVDGKNMMGTDGTLVLESTEIFGDSWSSVTSRIRQIVNERIEHLKRLAHSIKLYLRNASKIELKLVNGRGNILQTFDITKQVTDFGDLLNYGLTPATNTEIEKELGIRNQEIL